jgi:PIN domain nuclease of toxin-antitoxin system
MIYLLDTHVLIWCVSGSPNLSPKVISVIDNPDNVILVSKVSLWEIAIKIAVGKLKMSISFAELDDFLLAKKFTPIDFDFNDLNKLLSLPVYHRDPFDRILICQAISGDYTIITDDSKFKLYPVPLLS